MKAHDWETFEAPHTTQVGDILIAVLEQRCMDNSGWAHIEPPVGWTLLGVQIYRPTETEVPREHS